LIMDVEETKARNDCAGLDQQQFNRPTDNSGFSYIVVNVLCTLIFLIIKVITIHNLYSEAGNSCIMVHWQFKVYSISSLLSLF
jgi:hypothetical protein